MKQQLKLQPLDLQFFDMTGDSVFIYDLDGNFKYLNRAAYETRGYNRTELLKKGLFGLVGPDYVHLLKDINQKVVGMGGLTIMATHLHKDNSLIPVEVCARPIEWDGRTLILSVVRDITEHKRAEKELEVAQHFLKIANAHTKMDAMLGEFVAEVQNLTDCAAVGLRVLDKEGNIPYQSYLGFSKEFYELENPLSIKSDQCMCINVIRGKTDPGLSFYSEGGSFYMNTTTHFLAEISEEEKGTTRNVCNQFGYETVAVVPIRFGGCILGVIHVADPREGMAPSETIRTLENIGIQLGIALHRVQVEEELEQYRSHLETMVKLRTNELRTANQQLIKGIKEHELAEEALKESRQRYHTLFNSGNDAIFVHHPTPDKRPGTFIEVNDIACTILGYTRDELLKLSPMDIVDSDKVKLSPEGIMAKLFEEKQVLYESGFISKDGKRIPVEVNIRLFELEGKPTVLTIARDTTMRKQAEKKIYENEREIRKLALAYVHAQEEERQWTALEMHDRVIQPLSTINHQMQYLQSIVSDNPQIKKAAARIVSLLNDTARETRQVMQGLYPTALSRYGLIHIMNDELAQLEKQMGCQVKMSVSSHLSLPQYVETTLFRIFHEALINVVKHSIAKNVRVSIKCTQNEAKMEIEDDGCGFDIMSTSRNKGPGGLLSMKRRTEIIGGNFKLSSAVEQGTKLTICVPLV
jgi:PAS domain S-box-containing protein